MVPGKAAAEIKTKQPEELVNRFKTYWTEQGLQGEVSKSDETITLTLYGKTVHGMEPQNGVNGGLECLHFLNSLSFAGSDQSFSHLPKTAYIEILLGKSWESNTVKMCSDLYRLMPAFLITIIQLVAQFS